MARHMILRLQGPLMAFGGETIDNYGVIRSFPAKSMIVGLLANALGWRRQEWDELQALQDRLVMGAVIANEGKRLRDFQTAQLGHKDQGWTTRGRPEGRSGGAATYESPHLRYRDYIANAQVLVALRLVSPDDDPTLDDLAAALTSPARPLFLGRKPCLPSCPLFVGWTEADTILDALNSIGAKGKRAQWPEREGDMEKSRRQPICDERNWVTGVHGGWRYVYEGRLLGAAPGKAAS